MVDLNLVKCRQRFRCPPYLFIRDALLRWGIHNWAARIGYTTCWTPRWLSNLGPLTSWTGLSSFDTISRSLYLGWTSNHVYFSVMGFQWRRGRKFTTEWRLKFITTWSDDCLWKEVADSHCKMSLHSTSLLKYFVIEQSLNGRGIGTILKFGNANYDILILLDEHLIYVLFFVAKQLYVFVRL